MSDRAKRIATVIPGALDEITGLARTSGTKVIVDGKEMGGVIKVVLVAEPNDVWRAKIDCFVRLQDMPGMLVEVENEVHLSWWRKVLLRMAGLDV